MPCEECSARVGSKLNEYTLTGRRTLGLVRMSPGTLRQVPRTDCNFELSERILALAQ